MKNAIIYFYNIVPNDIHQVNLKYFFDYDGFRYFFSPYEGDFNYLKNIYDMHINLLKNGIYVHEIVLNKDSNIITMVDGVPYLLLKAKFYDGNIDMMSVYSFSNIKMHEDGKGYLWGELWSEKNDYLEYQLNKLGSTYPCLRNSFGYYIGLGENAISLVNMIDISGADKVLSHKRINSYYSLFDFYNPLNLVIDYKVRDMAEYFKSSFFDGRDIYNELFYYLNYGGLSNNDYVLFFARMLYPTYYFDVFEGVISGKGGDDDIKKITSFANDFEVLLKKIYVYIKKSVPSISIEWLEV